MAGDQTAPSARTNGFRFDGSGGAIRPSQRIVNGALPGDGAIVGGLGAEGKALRIDAARGIAAG